MSKTHHDPRDRKLGLSYSQRDRMAALRRRRDHLTERVENYRKDGNPSHDKAELSALEWAIVVVENAAHDCVLDDVTEVVFDEEVE